MNNATTLIPPLMAMIFLPMAVAVKLMKDRVTELKSSKIHPQELATRTKTQTKLNNTKTADNFSNLFEAPILFYALLLLNISTNKSNSALVILSWAYVLCRYCHSFIHCTYNKVMHRFYAFISSMMILFLIFINTVLLITQ